MKPVIRNILRSAVYQLKYMDSVPDRAVCSEAVNLAVRKGFSGLKGYVNGVLRSTARGLDQVGYPIEGTKALSVKYSCPEWIIELWEKNYSRETVETMLKDFQEEKPLTIRCRLDRISPEELRSRLEEEGVRTAPHPYLPYAFEITGYDYLDGLESFRRGCSPYRTSAPCWRRDRRSAEGGRGARCVRRAGRQGSPCGRADGRDRACAGERPD